MNVAIVKLSSVGDVVHALPVAAALRSRFPLGRVTWVVERREAALLRGNPDLDDVVSVDTRSWRRLQDLTSIRDMLGRLRRARFDVAVDLQGLLKTGLLTAATGARIRIGLAALRCREPVNALFTNRRVAPPASARHVVDQLLSLLAPLGATTGPPTFRLPSEPGAEEAAEAFFMGHGLKETDRVVVLNPGAGRADKRWPVSRFVELACRLRLEVGATVVVAWGPFEVEQARAIAEGAAALLAPPTNLDGLLALLRRIRVMVAADTGPLHLAAALGIPCVGLYGPTDPTRNGPYGAGHRILHATNRTMGSLAAAPVVRAVAELLDERR
ncbi:MAG: lipopolysaccharide heptosyltransferase I [Candidatus Rokuibacteriota bacterium]